MAPAITTLLSEGRHCLEGATEDPTFEAEILLAHVTGKGRTYFRAFANAGIPEAEVLQFRNLINLRRAGHPIAYITGMREFWSLPFEVTPEVLIPRPETELLVETALEWIQSIASPAVLDLGTGSGAIAVSLASERPDARITAVDLSAEALKVAQRNAERLNTPHIHFMLGNWLGDLPKDLGFDLIVSNPPYIPDQDPHLTQGDLRFEPSSALASGHDGLDDIRHIAREAQVFLKPHGGLILEHGYDQADRVQEILRSLAYSAIETIKDLQNHPRVTIAKYGP